MNSDPIIARFQRDLTLGLLLKTLLVVLVVGVFLLRPIIQPRIEPGFVLLGVAIVWVVLSMRSVKLTRLASILPSLIASGQFDLAEQRIVESLRTFSPFRTVKLTGLLHLAMLRHAQHRWSETAMLCRALLRQKPSGASDLSKSTRLMLAEAALAMGDLPTAGESISRLYQQRLSLDQALKLLSIQLDYEAAVGDWERMMHNIAAKVQLAEIMSTEMSARVQALLALAASRRKCDDWSMWLRRRVELLADIELLVSRRPMLRELWTT